MFKKMKRVISTALAVTGVFACAATFTACETPRPEVQMTITFNDETYTLDYVLYRKVTPATVNHFLALAENNYYDGTCIHDYRQDKWYAGAYKYENETLEYVDYYDTVKSYIPQSVWFDENKTNPTYTLYGEFEDNEVTWKNGSATLESYGSLVMYYTEKDTDGEVYIERADGDGTSLRTYEYNSATSQFYISTSSDIPRKNYCVFATLKDESVSVLQDLEEAIKTYLANYDGETDDEKKAQFAPETQMTIDEDDVMLGGVGSTVTYKVPQEPIVITSIEVKKY